MASKKKSEKTYSKRGRRPNKQPPTLYHTDRKLFHQEAHKDFIRWDVLTADERKKQKEPLTQTAFAKKWEVHIDTITDWRKRGDYLRLRGDAIREKLARETPEVMGDMRKRIKKYGSAFEVELWLAYVELWDRKQVLEIKPPLEFGENDIRALVAELPADKKKLYLHTLAKLIADAKQAQLRNNEQSVRENAN